MSLVDRIKTKSFWVLMIWRELKDHIVDFRFYLVNRKYVSKKNRNSISYSTISLTVYQVKNSLIRFLKVSSRFTMKVVLMVRMCVSVVIISFKGWFQNSRIPHLIQGNLSVTILHTQNCMTRIWDFPKKQQSY